MTEKNVSGLVRVSRIASAGIEWRRTWRVATGSLDLAFDGRPVFVELPGPARGLP